MDGGHSGPFNDLKPSVLESEREVGRIHNIESYPQQLNFFALGVIVGLPVDNINPLLKRCLLEDDALLHGRCRRQQGLDLAFRMCNQFVRLLAGIFHGHELPFHQFGLFSHSLPLAKHDVPLSSHFMPLTPHFISLTAINQPGEEHHNQLQNANGGQYPCKPRQFPLSSAVFVGCLLAVCFCMVIGCCGVSLAFRCNGRLRTGWRGLCGQGLIIVSLLGAGCALSTIGFGGPFVFWRFRWLLGEWEYDCENKQPSHIIEIVSQKHLTSCYLCNTVISMANVLSTHKQIGVISALAEGSSIRSIERMTGVHRDTIMRLGVKVGQGCTALMDYKMRDLSCTRLEMDEIWGFVGKKDRNVRLNEPRPVGNVWTFCAIDAETKLVPAFRVGDRDIATAKAFVSDVASRMRNRVQISTDGLRAYVEAIESAFGSEVDFAQIVKTYGHEEVSDNRRYSAPEFVSSEKKVITGNPDERLISTSYVERLNATTRLHMRRLTRLLQLREASQYTALHSGNGSRSRAGFLERWGLS